MVTSRDEMRTRALKLAQRLQLRALKSPSHKEKRPILEARVAESYRLEQDLVEERERGRLQRIAAVRPNYYNPGPPQADVTKTGEWSCTASPCVFSGWRLKRGSRFR